MKEREFDDTCCFFCKQTKNKTVGIYDLKEKIESCDFKLPKEFKSVKICEKCYFVQYRRCIHCSSKYHLATMKQMNIKLIENELIVRNNSINEIIFFRLKNLNKFTEYDAYICKYCFKETYNNKF